MFKAMQRARSDDSGFTLIELLIVIVILGVLAGIVIFAVGGITDKGNTAACKSDYKTLSVAVEAWYAAPNLGNGTYPSTLTAMVPGLLRAQPTLTATALGPQPGGYTINYDGSGGLTVAPAGFC